MTNDHLETVTSVSFDEFVQELVDHGLDVPLISVLRKLESYGVHIRGPYRAYYPVDSYVIYDGLSRRAGAILQRLIEDDRLEVVSAVAGHGDQVVPHGTFELDKPRREAGSPNEFSNRPPVVGIRDRQVLVRIKPTQAASQGRERFYEEQRDESNARVFVERSLSEEREARERRP